MEMYRIIICGDRYWTDHDKIKKCLLQYKDQTQYIVTGGCRGADIIAEQIAKELDIKVLSFPVTSDEWKVYGKSAGPRRNERMFRECNPNLVIGFHSNIQNSKGTKDTINRAIAKNIEYMIIK